MLSKSSSLDAPVEQQTVKVKNTLDSYLNKCFCLRSQYIYISSAIKIVITHPRAANLLVHDSDSNYRGRVYSIQKNHAHVLNHSFIPSR